DLAWRVWPDDVPRRMGDIDVLIRENERERALAMLKKDGWDAPYFYRSSHHEPQLVRKTARLEVHFRLPHFGVASTDAIWRKLRRVSPYEWQLSTEMNLLMLFCHSRGHRWKNAPQLLLDCGFLIRREGFPGWDRIDALAKEYALPSPAPFFAAFPDFFPEETRPEKSFPAELLHAFREVVTSPVPRRKDAEIVLAQSARFSLNWWKRRFAALHPSVIRLHTCNPHGHYGKLTLGYFQVNFRKLRDFARYIFSRRDRELKQRLQTEDTIEKFLR
ncbi:MAG: nucleotidyltransferase family protein, partial [Victivallaceae bacterium]|nr:nucleotidyltransferase family protein [Victivallaceae bacterium]